MPELWLLAAIAAKWALYLGVLGAAGTVFCILIFALGRQARLVAGFAVLGLVAAAASFMLKGVALTGDASGLTDPEMLGLLWQTQSGTALMMQGAGLIVLISGLALGRAGLWVSAGGGLLALGSLVSIGHIPDQGGQALQALLALHLIIAAIWIGILSPLRVLSASAALAEAAALGHRFGQLAMVAVPLLILAGVVMAYVLLGSLQALLSSSYGQVLVVKLILVAMLLGLAAANKLRFVPGLVRGEVNAARHLSRSITLEWIAFVLILGVTAVLTSAVSLPQ